VTATTQRSWLKDKVFTYENGIVLLLGFTFGIVFFDRNAIGVLGADIIADLGLSNTQFGLLGSGLSLAWALSAYIISSWSDQRGARKPFLLLSIVVFSLCSVFSGLATGFLMLLMARVVMGMAEGPFLPVCLSVINEQSSPKRRGVNIGLVQTLFASLLGSVAAPLLLVWLAQIYGWRMTFFLTGIPGLVCAALIWKYVREPKAPTAQEAQQASGMLRNALAMLKVRNILVCSLIAIFMVAWYLVSLIFLPVFFTVYRGFSPENMSYLMAAAGLATPIFGFLVPGLSDRFGRKPIMLIFTFIGLITAFTALWFSGPLWLMAILLFVGWSASGSFPLFMGVIPGETMPRGMAASAMGLVVGVGELLGGTLAPSFAGALADQTSLAAPVVIIGVCAFMGGVLSFFLVETAPNKVQQASKRSAVI
jgi:MFS transporter, ACS family, hexuronate transporter